MCLLQIAIMAILIGMVCRKSASVIEPTLNGRLKVDEEYLDEYEEAAKPIGNFLLCKSAFYIANLANTPYTVMNE